MDVTIEATQGGELTLRGVRFFATVLWIKETIRDRVGIPVESQRLFFMGHELDDGRDMTHYSIHHGSRLLLHAPFAVAAAPLGRSISPNLQAASGTVAPSAAVHAVASAPALGSSIPLDLSASGSLIDLLFGFGEAEREDGRVLADYNAPAEVMEVAVPVRQPADAANAGDRMMVMLESHGGNTALLEVSALDTPGEMRREVARMAAHLQPPEEYFFIHGQDIMRDERTLRWHDVRDGDTITLFPGTISSVSSSALP